MILIRVDDFGWTSQETETPPIKQTDVDLEIAQRFHEAMSGVPYLAGVIPACVTPRGMDWLRKVDGLAVALHGWDHGSTRPQERDEFSQMSAQEIRTAIDRGQKLIGPTQFFIPPYNAMPANLAEAAWHEGIRYIFGRESEWPAPPQPHQIGRVWFCPAWAPLYGASRWQQGAAQHADGLVGWLKSWGWRHAPAVLTLHITWEHARDPEFNGVRELAKLLDGHAVTAAEFVAETCR